METEEAVLKEKKEKIDNETEALQNDLSKLKMSNKTQKEQSIRALEEVKAKHAKLQEEYFFVSLAKLSNFIPSGCSHPNNCTPSKKPNYLNKSFCLWTWYLTTKLQFAPH